MEATPYLQSAYQFEPKLYENEFSKRVFSLFQVHARNILRALFRDTRLGEHVFPFVAEGVAIALQGFLSDSWAVSWQSFVFSININSSDRI